MKAAKDQRDRKKKKKQTDANAKPLHEETNWKMLTSWIFIIYGNELIYRIGDDIDT